MLQEEKDDPLVTAAANELQRLLTKSENDPLTTAAVNELQRLIKESKEDPLRLAAARAVLTYRLQKTQSDSSLRLAAARAILTYKSSNRSLRLGTIRTILGFMLSGHANEVLARQVEDLRLQLETIENVPRHGEDATAAVTGAAVQPDGVNDIAGSAPAG
jgi:hypothetical protein